MPVTRRRLIAFAAAAGAVSIANVQASHGEETAANTIVFAAASLKTALDGIAAQYETETGKGVKISYAASSTLAKQIEQGAPADVFISADLDWMDYVAAKNLIKVETRVNLLRNSLVLIAPKDSTAAVDIAPGFDLAKLLGGGRLAVGQVASVPAGKYAKAALEKLGAWDAVSAKLAEADNVRAALLLVSRGEAPLGIVYKTDAASDPSVKIVASFPEDSHAPIIYPAALVSTAKNPAAGFLNYVKSAKAKTFFEGQGFAVLSSVEAGSAAKF